MPDSTHLPDSDRIHRFARGELSPAEARDLAQASLESPALFDEVMATALAKGAVANVPAYVVPVRRVWWRSPKVLVAASSLAILIIVSVLVTKFFVVNKPSITTAKTVHATTPALKPTLSLSAGSSQPILLATDLQPSSSAQVEQIFRGEDASNRTPRQTGSIISVEDGLATIDLGSLDGISKGTAVEVYRDQELKHSLGRLRINTAFREQARGEIGKADFKAKYFVRASDVTYVQALLQRAQDFDARGQLTEARSAALQASTRAKAANVPLADKAKTSELVARLDFLAGDAESARTHYETALEILSSEKQARPEDIAEVQNNLAALAMLRGDYDSAQKALDQPTHFSNAKLEADRLNNMAVLAEQRGNSQQAEAFYTKALGALPTNLRREREIVEANLDRIKGPH